MNAPKKISALTRQRAVATIHEVAKSVLAGEPPITYSQLASKLGMSKVNGQGLSSYLNEAAAICADHNLPNVAVYVVSKDSLDLGTPMPSEGSFGAGFYASTGLTKADIPGEQEKVRQFDWKTLGSVDLDAEL